MPRPWGKRNLPRRTPHRMVSQVLGLQVASGEVIRLSRHGGVATRAACRLRLTDVYVS